MSWEHRITGRLHKRPSSVISRSGLSGGALFKSFQCSKYAVGSVDGLAAARLKVRDQHRISLLEFIQWGLEVCMRLYILLKLSIENKTRVGICYDTVLVVMIFQIGKKGKWSNLVPGF